MVTLTTPSECPVTMTFCVSHSFISDTQQHRICWLRPVKVLALAIGLPLMLHTWMYVPAQDTISPYANTHTQRVWTAFENHEVKYFYNFYLSSNLLCCSKKYILNYLHYQRRNVCSNSPSVHWYTERRRAPGVPWAAWRRKACWGPRWCRFDPASRWQRCGTLTML